QHPPDPRQRLLRPALLHEADHGIDDGHRHDHPELEPVAHDRLDRGGAQEDVDQGVVEVDEEPDDRGPATRLRQEVRSDRLKTGGRLRRGQPARIGAQPLRDVVGCQRVRPIDGCRRRAVHGCSYAAPSNMLVTEPSSKTSRIARASSGAMGRIVRPGKRSRSGTGMVSVTTTSSIAGSCRRSIAGSLKTAWVAATMTFSAPFAFSAWAAIMIVPPVSIMSSTSRHTRPSTCPTI